MKCKKIFLITHYELITIFEINKKKWESLNFIELLCNSEREIVDTFIVLLYNMRYYVIQIKMVYK